MNFSFKIDKKMNFKIENLPQKEYIEKENSPCLIAFSADAFFADLVSPIFKIQEKENENGN